MKVEKQETELETRDVGIAELLLLLVELKGTDLELNCPPGDCVRISCSHHV